MKPPLELRRLYQARTLALLTPLCTICLAAASLAQSSVSPSPSVPKPSTAASATLVLTTRQISKAEDAFLSGARMLDRRDYPAAEKHFARALQLSPANRNYLTALALTREHQVTDLVQQAGRARLAGNADHAEKLLAEARVLDPQNSIVTQHTDPQPHSLSPESWRTGEAVLAGAITLTPVNSSKSFHIHADVQQVIRSVASAYGLRPVIDDSVTHQSIRYDLEEVSYGQAMPILLQMSHLFLVPLDATSVLIARDTPENRQRLERQMQETIYVPGMITEQMSDLGNVIRNVFDIKQATVENSLGTVVIRGPEASLNAVNLMLADLLDGGSEVMLELKLFSVDLIHSRATGLLLPQQIGAYNVASQAQSLVSANQPIVNQAIAQGLIPSTASALQIAAYLIGSGLVTSSLLSNTIGIFGGGLTSTGVYATGGATLSFALNSSDARALDNIQLRVGDRQPAAFRVGSRYPITTSTYSTGVSGNASALAGIRINGVNASSLLAQYLGSGSGQTIPQVQYEDLGLTLKATPNVTKAGSVNIRVDLKIEALAGGSVDNIPILANRQIVSDITVKDGETALLLSNMNRSEAAAINGLPGLSELPGFQSVTDQTAERDSSQLVVLLTPRIVRHRSNALAGPRIPFTPQRVAAN